jgi:PQQ-like domain
MQTSFAKVSLGRLRISSQISPFLMLVGLCVVPGRSVAQKPILTWHYDNGRTGSNTKEVVLTPGNVNYKTFGKLSTKPVDGYVVAQPLYVPRLNMGGLGSHNVVFVATMHGSVYAFDADDTNTSPLWYTSVLTYSPAGATTVSATWKGNAQTTGWTELGIVSTPVIDLPSRTLFLVAETFENSQVVDRRSTSPVEWKSTAAQQTFGGYDFSSADHNPADDASSSLSAQEIPRADL